MHLYAADLARAPDGRWWVVGDATDAPLGLGYALENRIATSRMLPDAIRNFNIERLAPFFMMLQETLRELAPAHRDNPRIVLLSHGPSGPNYFEDAFLARYLGLHAGRRRRPGRSRQPCLPEDAGRPVARGRDPAASE